MYYCLLLDFDFEYRAPTYPGPHHVWLLIFLRAAGFLGGREFPQPYRSTER